MSDTDGFTLDPLNLLHQCWSRIGDPDLPGFVESLQGDVSDELLVDLIKVDLDWRWRSAQGRRLESYFSSWPHLAGNRAVTLELIATEWLTRGTYHRPPTADELNARFGELAGRLNTEALGRQAKAASLEKSYDGEGRFFCVRKVGAGGMGVVYAALDRERQTIVALKTLTSGSPERLTRFKHEFRALSEVVHPNLVPLYELISGKDGWFFTMELIDGVDLRSYVRRGGARATAPTKTSYGASSFGSYGADDSGCGSSAEISDEERWFGEVGGAGRGGESMPKIDEEELSSLLRQLFLGLESLHAAGVLHRDIKPSNVLVRNDGQVVILDFGLIAEIAADELSPAPSNKHGACRSPDTEEASRSGGSPYDTNWSAVGTMAYMSPEQAMAQPLTPATDWYSAGVMLYELLTGRRPFHGSKESVLRAKQEQTPRLPSALDLLPPEHPWQICAGLLQRDPQRRLSGEEVLRRLKASARSSDPLRSGVRDAPFVGRADSLAKLKLAYSQMHAGAAVVAEVSGPTGVGKSRLVRQFLRKLASDAELVVLQGRCYERESVPYKALDQLVDSLCSYLGTLPRRELTQLVPPGTGSLARLFPGLGRLTWLNDGPGRSAETDDVQELRNRAVDALAELLARIGERRPLVLWIDDLQWDDADSAVVLSSILRRSQSSRLLLIVSVRSEQAKRASTLEAIDEVVERRADESTCQRHLVEVGPLDPGESEQLAARLLERLPEASGELVRVVARQSRGAPYFLHELAHYVSAHQSLSPSSPALRDLELQDVFRARLESLPEEERNLLETVAVAGRPVKLSTAYRVADLDQANRQVVVSLRSSHLLRTTGPKLSDETDVFHDRLRTGVLALLPDDRALVLHARLATALEEDRDDAERIATHYHRAQMTEQAIRYYTLAADGASAALAFERAARLYQASIDLIRQSRSDEVAASERAEPDELTRKLAEALANAGRGRRAADAYLRLASRCDDAAASRHWRKEAAYQCCASGHIEEGRRQFAMILSEVGMRLPRSPRAAIVSCLWRRLKLKLRGLDFQLRDETQLTPDELRALDISWSVSVGLTMIDTIHAADFQSLNLLLALRAGEPYRLVRALAWQATHIATVGVPARRQSQRLLDTAESIVSKVGNAHARGLLTIARGITAFFQGDWQRALARSDEGEQILRENCTGVVWERSTAQSFALWALYFLGETGALRRRQPELLRAARQRGDLLADASLSNLSGTLIWLSRNQPGEAIEALDRAMRPWQGLGFRTQHFTSLAGHAQIDLYLGKACDAHRRIESEWPMLRRSMLLHIEAIRIFMRHLRGCCSVAAAAERPGDRGLKLANRCAKRLGRERAPWGRAMGQLLQASIAELQGQRSAAAARLAVAASHLEEAQMGLHVAAARRRQGELLGGQRGRTLVAEAEQWMSEQQIEDPAAMANMLVPRIRSE